MCAHESSDEWNERQAKNMELDQCCRDNPLVALGKPRDILAILREGSDRKVYPQWWSICKQAADEIERLRGVVNGTANTQGDKVAEEMHQNDGD